MATLLPKWAKEIQIFGYFNSEIPQNIPNVAQLLQFDSYWHLVSN